MAEYGVRWMEFDRNDCAVGKERIFPTEAKRAAFVAKLEKKANFGKILAWSNPAK